MCLIRFLFSPGPHFYYTSQLRVRAWNTERRGMSLDFLRFSGTPATSDPYNVIAGGRLFETVYLPVKDSTG